MDWFTLVIGLVAGYYIRVGMSKADSYLKERYTKKDDSKKVA